MALQGSKRKNAPIGTSTDRYWRPSSPGDTVWHELSENYFSAGVAGALYGFLVSGGMLTFVTVYELMNLPINSWGPVFVKAFWMLGLVALASLIGFLAGALSGLVSMGIVGFVNLTLQYSVSPTLSVWLAGGLAGYLPTSWITLALIYDGQSRSWVAVGLGPVLATVFGSVGAWLSSRGRFDFASESNVRRTQLTIIRLMIVTVWCAVLLGFCQLVGSYRLVILIVAWFAIQVPVLGLLSVLQIVFSVRPAELPESTIQET